MAKSVHERRVDEVRLVTYLSPSIPLAIFETLADHLRRYLGRVRVSLRAETRVSGPRGDEGSSFGDQVDVAFVCAPSSHWLRGLHPPPAESRVPGSTAGRSFSRPASRVAAMPAC